MPYKTLTDQKLKCNFSYICVCVCVCEMNHEPNFSQLSPLSLSLSQPVLLSYLFPSLCRALIGPQLLCYQTEIICVEDILFWRNHSVHLFVYQIIQD